MPQVESGVATRAGADTESSETLALLERLTGADAVPGHEDELLALLRQLWSPWGELGADRLGSIYCVKTGSASRPRILLDTHVDEVGFIVRRVTPAGLVQFLPLGNWWPHALLAQRVRISTGSTKIPGVIGSRPPHLLKAGERERVLDFSELFIDVGAESQEQAEREFGIRPGCPVAPDSPFTRLAHPRRVAAKAFDNRIGVALATETVQRLTDHPNTVVIAGCVQEEVGMRGARTLVECVRPDLALVLEGPYADDSPPGERSAMQCRLGGGVHIRLYDPTMIPNPRLAELVVGTARTHGIPHQVAVWTAGGTDGAAIHQAGRGVPSIVLGVPVRYIHSHASILDLDDYRAALTLLLRLIPVLDHETVAAITRRN